VLHVDAADTEKTIPASAPQVIEIPQMLPIVVAPAAADAVVQGEVLVEFTERVSPASKRFAQLWPPVALLVGSVVGILAFAIASGDGDEAVAVETKPTPAATTNLLAHGSLAPARQALSPEPSQASSADLALDRIRAAALTEEENLGDTQEEIPSAAPALAPTAAPAPAPTSAPRAVNEGLQESIGGVKIWQSEGKLVIRLPIEGSLERASNYLLADPPGIAINLPYAQPSGGFHATVSPQHEQIRTLWVRERLGGLHFRVFFSDAAESCDVKYGESAVVVRCGF
jgi:hypothetical protein